MARIDNSCRVAEKPGIGKSGSTRAAASRKVLERSQSADVQLTAGAPPPSFGRPRHPRRGSPAFDEERAGSVFRGVAAGGTLGAGSAAICAKRRTIRLRAACHSATTSPNVLFPMPWRTITTTVASRGHESRTARNASRTRRLARFRSTAFPIRRDAVIPRRGGPG
jgi:hypothetical protein